jgi:transposase
MAAELARPDVARPDVARRRRRRIERRQPRMRHVPGRLVSLGGTAVTTEMARLRGRARRGARLKARAPSARWGTQTFIAAPRADRLTAPRVAEGAINREGFNTYIETRLAPTLSRGDVVILDNLSVHQSARAKAALRERGGWFLFLPQYSPDLNPIEMAFATLNRHSPDGRRFRRLSSTLPRTLRPWNARALMFRRSCRHAAPANSVGDLHEDRNQLAVARGRRRALWQAVDRRTFRAAKGLFSKSNDRGKVELRPAGRTGCRCPR